MMSASHYLF